jgi:hypothetical protein
MDLAELIQQAKQLDKDLATGRPSSIPPELAVKREAKEAELAAGGHEADLADWVRRYRDGLIDTTTQLADDQRIFPGQAICARPVRGPAKDVTAWIDLIWSYLESGRAPQPAAPKPKPTEERTVEELYPLLREKWLRYLAVMADPNKKATDRKAALINFQRIAELMISKGAQEADLVAYLEAN